MLLQKMDSKADSYALGVLIYVMLSGYAPSTSENVNQYKAYLSNLKMVNLNHRELWTVTFDCKSLLLSLITKNNKRLDPIELIKSVWLEETEKELVSFQADEEKFDQLVSLL